MSEGADRTMPVNGQEEVIVPNAAIESLLAPARLPYVIDTSVAVKWYIPELLSTEAKRYLGQSIDRHAPDYLPIEGASMALKRSRRKLGDPDLLSSQAALLVAEALPRAPIQYKPSGPLVELAFALATQVGTSLYDGLFLALSLRLKGQLVTADRKLFDKLAASPYSPLARWVEQEP